MESISSVSSANNRFSAIGSNRALSGTGPLEALQQNRFSAGNQVIDYSQRLRRKSLKFVSEAVSLKTAKMRKAGRINLVQASETLPSASTQKHMIDQLDKISTPASLCAQRQRSSTILTLGNVNRNNFAVNLP